MTEETYNPEFDDPDFKSKSQIKQEMHELRQLGIDVAELPLRILDTLDMSLELRRAIDDYRRIGHKNALKRQASFIGKLMRKEDADAIRAQLDQVQESRHQATRQFHLVEQWRDRLIDEETNALESFLTEYYMADRQQLRSLIRAAKREKQEKKPPTNARKLFKFIQECLSEQEQ